MDENKNPESISVASKVKFKDVASLLEKIAKIDDATLTASSRGGQGKNDAKKTELESFMQTWRTIGDKMKAANSSSTRKVDENFFPVMRFLLPADDRRVYGLKEVKLAKALCDALCIGVRTDDGQKLINYRAPVHMKSSDGDFASVAYFVLKNRCQESNTLSVEEVNHYLNTISSNNAKGKEGQKEVNESIKHLLVNLSALQLKWLIRIILKDLKIGMKEATILDAYHPDAMDLYNFTSSLEKVCDTLNDPKKRLHEVGIELFSPCRPMLGERAKPNEIEKLMAGKSFYIETKFDGERFQLHMSRNQEAKSSDNTRKYVYFSRNGHDFTSTFGADVYSDGSLTPFIDKCFKAGCDSVILDGEMCGYNAREKYFLPLSDEYDVKSNKKVGEEIQTCFCVFDVLYFNGDVLTNKTLKERLEYMQKAFDEIDGRIVYSTREVASTNQNVVDALNKAIDSRLEGIVVKSPDSVYKPSVRSGSGWFKVKPDYMLGLNDDLDLLIVGGYYGVGRRSGLISHFLLAVAVVDDSSSSSSNKKPPKKTIDDDDELDFEGDDKPQTADESPVKQTPTLFYSFCKIGTGYSMKELHDFNQKLANKWTPFDKKAPPKHLQVTFERPDVWVEPKDSFIVQVKAVEICQSDKYKTGCTLKFPRLEKFRPDKAWHECMTLKELNDLREKNAGYLASGKHYALGGEEGEEDGDEPTKKKKKMSSTIKKLTVASNFRGIDASLVDRVGEAFDGKQFCVVVDEDYTKKTLVEKQIAELGGDIVQNPGVDTYCIVTSKITHRIQGYIRRNVYNIARLEWLQRCIADRTLHAWRPSDLIHATDAQQTRFSKLYDEYGDSFTEDTNLELLRALFDKMSSSPDYAVEQPSEDMYRRIAEIENEYYPDESAQFGLFRLCDVFVHPGVTPSRDLLMLRIRWKGGRISQAISPSTTHCIADKSDLKSLDELKKLNRSRERKIHIVSRDWVEQCIRDERQVNELSFHL